MNRPPTSYGDVAGRPARVLVVDDEEGIRRNLASGLQDLGYDVSVATDGRGALEQFDRQASDIVLADLFMPGMSGLELIDVLKEKSPLTPVIIVSSSGTLHDAVKAIRLGAWDYVIKPVENSDELDLMLRRNLSRALLLRENLLQKRQLEVLLAENAQKLKESDVRIRLLSDNLPDSMVYQILREPDGTLRFLHLSAGLERLNGLAVGAVLRDNSLFFNQIMGEDRAAVLSAREESALSLKVFNVNARFRRADGQVRWMNLCSAPRRLTDGRIVWDGIETDITERKLAEAALIQSEERFSRMFQNCPIPISLTRLADGTFLDVNERFIQMSGYTRAEVLGSTALGLNVYPDPSRRGLILEQLRGHGHLYGHEQLFRTKSGQIRNHLLWLDVVSISGEQCILVIALDVTEQKQAEAQQKQLEEQLRQAQKLEALGTLAGGIAHDFNNILCAIIAYTQLAQMDNPGNAELQEQLGEVFKAGQRATTLVRQILSFSRRQKPERRVIQLTPVIKEALNLLRATLPSTISIEPTVDGELPDVLADPTQIHQILMNLCTNAAQAMKGKQGCLRIRLDAVPFDPATPKLNAELRDGDYVRLIISDTGHGMDAKTLARIFEPFFTTKGPGEGTGLGLSVVHGIVKEHQGVIAVESAPGAGTTITIYLPVQTATENPEAQTGAVLPRGNGERIFLVDDEPALGEVIRQMLGRLGYQAVVFTHPEAAWKEIEINPEACDVLISDLTMPGMTGLDLARKVLGLRPDLPIIIITGSSSPLTKAEIQAAGIRELMSKPLDYESFALTIDKTLHEPAG